MAAAPPCRIPDRSRSRRRPARSGSPSSASARRACSRSSVCSIAPRSRETERSGRRRPLRAPSGSGAGPVYDPRQPEYLRMNFAADQVSLGRRTAAPPSPERLTFAEWRAFAAVGGRRARIRRARWSAATSPTGFERLPAHARQGARIEAPRRPSCARSGARHGGWTVARPATSGRPTTRSSWRSAIRRLRVTRLAMSWRGRTPLYPRSFR